MLLTLELELNLGLLVIGYWLISY